ncbi:MBL fold metallo-hydrolase [Bacillaceae bacterium S4-13-56]
MSKTTLTFYSGLRTIGGTIISLEYGNSRVLFDFGFVYSPASNIFDGQVQQRPSAFIRDYLKLGMLHKIDGIYHKEALLHEPSLLSAQEDQRETAVLISHLHLDHMGAMGAIDASIPVYMTSDSLRLYGALETVGEGVSSSRSYQSCEYNQAFFVGDIKITPLIVDHDVLGACAYHLETPDGAIVYTGDLRMHGAHPDRIESFIKSAKAKGFDAVIMEGTTLSGDEEPTSEELMASPLLPSDLVTEKMIPIKMGEILKDTKGIGIFNIYHRNMDRIQGIIEAARISNRKVVLEISTAEITSKLLAQVDFFIYESEDLRQAKANNSLPEWQVKLLDTLPTVSYKDINEHPNEFFVQNSYQHSLELFDLHVKDGIYLHSNGVPLGSFDPAFENLEKILQNIGLERMEIGTGGHAIPQHLKYIVDELDPAILIPLHSFHPERLKSKHGIQLLPSYGVTYILTGGKMTEEVK